MPTVGAGVYEMRIHTATEHRVFYIAKFEEAIYVLHACEKRTRQTRQADIDLAGARLREIVRRRTTRQEAPMSSKIHRGSDNVFADLGFDPEEAEHLRVRSDLMIELTKLLQARGLTQTQAATLFGVTQPRISDLTRGKIDRFSIDTLVAMLGHAGISVRFSTKRRPKVA